MSPAHRLSKGRMSDPRREPAVEGLVTQLQIGLQGVKRLRGSGMHIFCCSMS